MEENIKKIELDFNGWYAICNDADIVEAVFPSENNALWYLERHGWSDWKTYRISAADKDLFFLKHQNRRTDDNQQ